MIRYGLVILVLFVLSCKKAEERTCLKTPGVIDTLTYTLDSVQRFNLFDDVTYRFYQSDERVVRVIGAANLIHQIHLSKPHFVLTIMDKNHCDFLRRNHPKVEVEIYYPHYNEIYAEIEDSLIFDAPIKGNYLSVELREGGGVAALRVNVNDLRLKVTKGVGHFILQGHSKYATLKVQGAGFGDAQNFWANHLSVYHNSSGYLAASFNQAKVNVLMDGAGPLWYRGDPITLSVGGIGVGTCIKID